MLFVADNADFAEDTPDEKGTTQCTIVAVYQKKDAPGEAVAPPLTIKQTRNQTIMPYHVRLEHCEKPKPNQEKRRTEFAVSKEGIATRHQLSQLAWIVVRVLSRMKNSNYQIACCAGYNSLKSHNLLVTEIGALPLMPEPAHEWSTLLTVLTQAIALQRLIVGDDHLTIITFDMALYEKVVQLLDARPDKKQATIPRLGELHAVMTALRALGASIDNSGIDDAWIEGDIYGATTTRQILNCIHYKHSLKAHIYSYVAL